MKRRIIGKELVNTARSSVSKMAMVLQNVGSRVIPERIMNPVSYRTEEDAMVAIILHR